MNVTIIHSNGRKENTWEITQMFRYQLSKYQKIEFKEHDLSSEFPYFCTGCHNCFLHGEQTCPHFQKLQPILEDFLSADGVILDSPVYCMDVSGQMKSFLDHLGYMWIAHRPRIANFFAVGMAISTASNGGCSYTNKTMERSFEYLGFRRWYHLGVLKSEIEEEKTRKRVVKAAKKFYQTMLNKDEIHPHLYQQLFFQIMKKKILSADQLSLDRQYWDSKGWLEGMKPWKYE